VRSPIDGRAGAEHSGPPLAVEMTGITKYFPSSEVLANDHVDFAVAAGEVHALVGENGAGKTTLMNILFGLVPPDAGAIAVHGHPVRIHHPDEAIRLGIGMVHQHFKLVPSFTVAQNILLGVEPTRYGFVRRREETARVRALEGEFGLPVDPAARVGDLPVSLQQRVEILKTLQRDARILILDEPTAVLTPQEAQELFGVIRGLAGRGRTVIFITHKLLEVMEVAHRVSVMRRGRMIGTKPVAETNVRELARMMVGRDVLFRVSKPPARPGEPVLEVERLSVSRQEGVPAVSDLSLTVRAGEIVGIAGVSGNGQSELVEAVTGLRPADGGTIRLLGRAITQLPVWDRRERGMAHIPEDRLTMGLNLQTTLDENVVVSRYREPQFAHLGLMVREKIRTLAEWVISRFSVSAARTGEDIATLSGGNLQKVVLGRELSGDPKCIIANQPTRGLDVGSIEFVHQTLIDARDRGVAVLLVSVELDETLALADRILVLFRGRIVGELDATRATEEELGILMAGGALETAS
jgi:ABC-type uncharacterized transport system ATPase subunit